MKKILLFLSFLFVTHLSFAQSDDEKAIKSVVMELFEGIQKHDSTLLKSIFHNSARVQTVGVNRQSGKNVINTENDINNFINKICRNSINISMREVPKSFAFKIENQLATAWVPYEFYIKASPSVEEEFSHSGIDIFQLFETEEGWKIISLTYSIHRRNLNKQ